MLDGSEGVMDPESASSTINAGSILEVFIHHYFIVHILGLCCLYALLMLFEEHTGRAIVAGFSQRLALTTT